jgi:type IV pilus assembly protein PilM
MMDRVPQMIRSLSLPSEAETLEERVPTIVEELERTITFYNSSHLDNPLDQSVPIFVSGDLGAATETWPSLVGDSGYSVSALPSPLQDIQGFDSTQFMVNVGLAMKPLSLEKDGANYSLVNFNVLPQMYQPKKTPASTYIIPIAGLVGVGLLVLMGLFVRDAAAQTTAMQAQLPPLENRVSMERKTIADLTGQIEPMQPEIDSIKEIASVIGAILPGMELKRTEMDGDLSGIVGLWPEGIDLITLNHDGNPVTLTGNAIDEETILQYARDLRSSGRYSSVIITSITAIEEQAEEQVEEGEEMEEEETRGYQFEFLLIG